MSEREELRESGRALARRLEGASQFDDLKAIYLDLSVLVGQVQGAVHDAGRSGGARDNLTAAQASFEEFRRSVRQVGFDIRLASPAALQVGMQTALDHARRTMELLENVRD